MDVVRRKEVPFSFPILARVWRNWNPILYLQRARVLKECKLRLTVRLLVVLEQALVPVPVPVVKGDLKQARTSRVVEVSSQHKSLKAVPALVEWTRLIVPAPQVPLLLELRPLVLQPLKLALPVLQPQDRQALPLRPALPRLNKVPTSLLLQPLALLLTLFQALQPLNKVQPARRRPLQPRQVQQAQQAQLVQRAQQAHQVRLHQRRAPRRVAPRQASRSALPTRSKLGLAIRLSRQS